MRISVWNGKAPDSSQFESGKMFGKIFFERWKYKKAGLKMRTFFLKGLVVLHVHNKTYVKWIKGELWRIVKYYNTFFLIFPCIYHIIFQMSFELIREFSAILNRFLEYLSATNFSIFIATFFKFYLYAITLHLFLHLWSTFFELNT